MTETTHRKPLSFTFTAFLLMCFAMTGLVGTFANFASPLPLQRMAAREIALDEAVQALSAGNPAAALQALASRLDESATPIMATPNLATITAERHSMRARMQADAAAVSTRMQVMILCVTALAGVFGAAILAFSRR